MLEHGEVLDCIVCHILVQYATDTDVHSSSAAVVPGADFCFVRVVCTWGKEQGRMHEGMQTRTGEAVQLSSTKADRRTDSLWPHKASEDARDKQQ